MKNRLMIGLTCILLMGCLSGCVAHGHRKVDMNVFGMQFTFEDQVMSDDVGKQDYATSFDGNLWKVVFGWLAETAKTEPEVEPESTDDDG